MRWFRASVLALLALLGACREGDAQPTAPIPTPPPPETTTAQPETTTARPPSPSPAETTAPLPSPITTAVEHGGTYFGVYLAVAPFDTPELDAAVAQLAALGIEAFPGSIGCDQGAAAQLGVREDLATVAVYFQRFRDATRFARSLVPPPLGIAQVQTFCAD